MNERVERLKQVANLLDETHNGMAAVGVDEAVEYLISIERQLADAKQRAAELEQALKAQLAILKPCVELYANHDHWKDWLRPQHLNVFVLDVHRHYTETDAGFAPAQAALAKVDGWEVQFDG